MIIVQGYLTTPLIVTQGYSSAAVPVGPFVCEVTARPTYSAEARAEATYSVEATARGS